MKLNDLLSLILALHKLFSIVQSRTIEEDLIKHLLANTSDLVRPKIDKNKHILVTYGLELIQMVGLDEANQYLTGKYWVRQSWYNEYMKWNITKWGNIKSTQVTAALVWTPDIVLYNNANTDGVDRYKSMVSMYPDGRQYWLSPVTFTSSCKIQVMNFPFDGQSCALKFGSWTFNTRHIALKADDKPVISDNFIPSTEWDVIEAKIVHHSLVYEHYGHVPYDDVTYIISMLRKETSYLFYMITPCLMLVLTTLFSFSLPPDSGERIIVIVANLLAFAIFLNMTNQFLPRNSDAVTTISIFYLVLMIESALSLLMACCVMTVYHHGRQPLPPEVPRWLKKLFLSIYLKIYGIDASGFSSKDKPQLAKPSKVKEESESYTPAYTGSKAIPERIFSPKCKSKSRHRLLERKNRYSLPIELYTTSHKPPVKTLQTHNHKMESVDNDLEVNHLVTNVFTQIQYITEFKTEKNRREALRIDWELLGIMLDRLYFWLFMIMVLVSNVYILSSGYVARRGLNNTWQTNHDEK